MNDQSKEPSVAGANVQAPALSRRSTVLGLAAVGATLAGAGVAWWSADTPAVPTSDGLGDAFWALQWETPQGGTLPMRSFLGKPVLLNFWATWCPPCVEELPLINNFYRQNKASGWQVLGLAVDKLAPVQAFLRAHSLDFPVAMAGLSGAELARTLGNASGGLPFSVILGGQGTVLHRKLGRLTSADLEAWVRLK